MLNKEVLLP